MKQRTLTPDEVYQLLRRFQDGTLQAPRPSTCIGCLDEKLTALYDQLMGTEPFVSHMFREETKR
jgi:hypothetical protein